MSILKGIFQKSPLKLTFFFLGREELKAVDLVQNPPKTVVSEEKSADTPFESLAETGVVKSSISGQLGEFRALESSEIVPDGSTTLSSGTSSSLEQVSKKSQLSRGFLKNALENGVKKSRILMGFLFYPVLL